MAAANGAPTARRAGPAGPAADANSCRHPARPSAVAAGVVADRADETRIHDEWTRLKFNEGKYKSSEIYGSPRDPQLKKEYEEYLKKRLEELRSKRGVEK